MLAFSFQAQSVSASLDTCIDWLSLMTKHHLSGCFLLFMVYDLCHGASIVIGLPEIFESFLLSAFHGALQSIKYFKETSVLNLSSLL